MTAPAARAAPRKTARKPARDTPRATPAVPEAVRASLTPETWIDAATEVLVDQGIDRVRVDLLATQLGVTRGSFYWHFRDRDELLRRVLQAWHARATEQLTKRLATARSDPREQLRDVISLPFRGRAAARAARIELAIRAWARRDEMARRAVDEADASRIAYHTQVFAALGFAADEAAMRAFLLYSYEVAESVLNRQGSAQDKRARSEFVERLVCTPLKAPRGASSTATPTAP